MEQRSLSLDTHTQARAYLHYLKELGAAGGNRRQAMATLTERLGHSSSFVAALQKATVGAFADSDLNYAPLSRGFMEIAGRGTVLDSLAGTLPLPMNARVSIATSVGTAAWVGPGQPAPFARLGFDAQTSQPTKIVNMVAFPDELFTRADEAGVSLIGRLLGIAIKETEDSKALSADAPVDTVSPAGLLYGISASGAGSPGDVGEDVRMLWEECRDGEPDKPAFITSASGAMYLAQARDPNGGALFPNIGPLGGNIFGVPVIISKAAADKLILVDAAGIAVSDAGLVVDVARSAAVEMLDAPTNSATTGTGAALVSAFQANAIVLRLTRMIHWRRGYADAVAFITLPSGSPA